MYIEIDEMVPFDDMTNDTQWPTTWKGAVAGSGWAQMNLRYRRSGLSGAPPDTPVSTHALALAAHVVYGLTTEVVRRAVRRILH